MSGSSAGPTRPAGALDVRLRLARGPFVLDAAFRAVPGRTLALAGPNGAGKTTIVESVAGLVEPDDGVIRLGDRVLDDTAGGVHVPPESRRVGVVFQDDLLFPHLSVLDNVAFGPRSAGASRRESRERAVAWLDRFAIGELAARRRTLNVRLLDELMRSGVTVVGASSTSVFHSAQSAHCPCQRDDTDPHCWQT